MATTTGTSAELIPEEPTLDRLRFAAADCKACDLWARATRTVFGEGDEKASAMLIGEQPATLRTLKASHSSARRENCSTALSRSQISTAGRPTLRTRSSISTGARPAARSAFTRSRTHAKWQRANHGWKRRFKLLRPTVIVLLGATAAQQLLGPGFSIMKNRGKPIQSSLAQHVIATVHPSSILRAPDDESRQSAMVAFVQDLRKVTALVKVKKAPVGAAR